MICLKCDHEMVKDEFDGVNVFKCWCCGNRIYMDYLPRIGVEACVKCGDPIKPGNGIQYCPECMKFIHSGNTCLANRTYGETVCRCGIVFVRKTPTQTYHSKDCWRSYKNAKIRRRRWLFLDNV